MKPKINRFWGILTLALLLLTLVLCGVGAKRGVLLIRTDLKPEETAQAFLDAIVAGKYQEADALLDNYKSLGLAEAAGTKRGDALLSSYRYVLQGEPERKSDTALQPFTLRYLDLNALEKDLSTPIAIIEPSDGSEPRPVYAELRELLEKPENYYTTAELQLTLRYSEGQWRVVADDALLSALAGGK